MPSQVSSEELGTAILQSVERGAFPQSEHVASAAVPSGALPKLLEVVSKARDDTKAEIRNVSRAAASNVDGWIAQARKLQDDIRRSQETAHEIVQQAELGSQATSRVQDATAKVSFLYSEIGYNESLVKVVEQLRDITTLLEAAQDAAIHGNVVHALERLEDVHGAFKRLGPFENTRVVGVLKEKANQLRAALVENLTESWNGLLIVDLADRYISFKDSIQKGASTIDINTVVEALTKLGLLEGFVGRLSRDFDKIILSPRLAIGPDQVVSAFEIHGDDIRIMNHVNNLSVTATVEDLHAMTEYLSTRLPPSVAIPLSDKLVPIIANRLVTNWLLPAVPVTTNEIHDFQKVLSLVTALADHFDELEWSGQERLQEWVNKAAEIWLSRQKEVAIARVHQFCPRCVNEKKTVERVETQLVSKGDVVLGGQEDHEDDWGAEWGEEEDHPPSANEVQNSALAEEEDMSAWDDEDESQASRPDVEPEIKDDTEEENAEAWGWGDEEDSQADAYRPADPTGSTKANGQAPRPSQPVTEKEVTLRETYTVTAIPDSIMEIIMQIVSDVGILNQPEYAGLTIAPASIGLYAIPSLLMAMYRATAASHYSKDVAGNMLIYNDCTRLADRLRIFIRERADAEISTSLPHHLRPSAELKLGDDISATERYGKRAYGREMESQRTIIRDLLDGAQGFQSCTRAPFAAECDNSVAMTIERIQEVKRQWQSVLSHSALLQSLGSLVSTALTKFINDVEDMSDIAEDESKKLRGYCVSLSSLSSLFQTDNNFGEAQNMVSIYTPNWFKFQYLGEILDSNLADIRYFWTDGELKLEMEAEEVVDLITALFAESDHRRKAIGEIRRTSVTG